MAGLMQKFKDLWNPPEEEYGDYDYEEEQRPEEQPARPYEEERRQPSSYRHSEPSASAQRAGAPAGGKVVKLNPAASQLQVVIFKAKCFNNKEICTIADELLRSNTVVLNLEEAPIKDSRRIIDFLSGIAYANGGKIKGVAMKTFIITPYNVDLMGDDPGKDNTGETECEEEDDGA
ncbi:MULTISPECIES: cell division protein SepF [Caproicibacterium]|uniref:Cell division protein SepF n=1 Tax=Caproicibacterium argilliputei TaxID=3030016 RepID=A0AA97D680_9FIRM|nr:cell division protein SepF [Caproicibacterium argilliputei]WOC31325.1 cell division protein SepF [Caproicibacterium argilliputei]